MRNPPIRSRFFARLTASRFLAVFAASLLGGCAAGPGVAPAPGNFGLMGDTPYNQTEAGRLDLLIDDLNAEPLSFIVHVGDITSGGGPCTDAWMEARQRQFARILHPFVLLPGDNDWTDCHRTGFDPVERLAKWRTLFCELPKGLRVERQKGEYCEHLRWEHAGMMFVTLNVQASNNNLGRTPAMDAEHAKRMFQVFEWLDESVAAAEARGVAKLVVLMQADPFDAPPRGRPDGLAPVRKVLAAHARWLKGKLVLVHGDGHVFRDDEPLPGLRRIEVFGSPLVSWLRAAAVNGELRVSPAPAR